MQALESLLKQISLEYRPRPDIPLPPLDDIIEYITINIGRFKLPDFICEDSSTQYYLLYKYRESDMEYDIRMLSLKLLHFACNTSRVNGKIADSHFSRFILPFYIYLSGRSTGIEREYGQTGLTCFSITHLRSFYQYLINEDFSNYDIYDILKTQPICEAILTKLTEIIEKKECGKKNEKEKEGINKLTNISFGKIF